MTESSASSHVALSNRRTAKEGRRPELEGREYMSSAMKPSTPVPTLCPTTCRYSHRAFLLEALPLGSAGGSGRQDVQEDTHLGSGKVHERTREHRQFLPCLEASALPRGDLEDTPILPTPTQFLALTETAKATGPAKLQMSVS